MASMHHYILCSIGCGRWQQAGNMSVLFFHQNARIQFSIDTNSPKTDRSTGPKISSDLPFKPTKHHLGRIWSLVSSSWANTLKKKSLWMRLNAQKRKPPHSGHVKICLVGYRNSILHNLLTSSGYPTSVRFNPCQYQQRYPSIFLFFQPHPPIQAIHQPVFSGMEHVSACKAELRRD